MSKDDFMRKTDTGKDFQFGHFRDHIVTHFGPLNLTTTSELVVDQKKDADYFHWVLMMQQALSGASQQATAAKNRLRDGDPDDPDTLVTLNFPSPGLAPPAVRPGVVARFRDYVKTLKATDGYTPDIGEALLIEGPEQEGADLATVKPVLRLKFMGGLVFVDWKWDGLSGQVDSLEIEVNRGAGLGMLTIDTNPGYLDTMPLPVSPAMWKYRGIFRVGDERVGLWSDLAEIAVG